MKKQKLGRPKMLSKRSFISSKTILLKIRNRICHVMQMDLQIQVEQFFMGWITRTNYATAWQWISGSFSFNKPTLLGRSPPLYSSPINNPSSPISKSSSSLLRFLRERQGQVAHHLKQSVQSGYHSLLLCDKFDVVRWIGYKHI